MEQILHVDHSNSFAGDNYYCMFLTESSIKGRYWIARNAGAVFSVATPYEQHRKF